MDLVIVGAGGFGREIVDVVDASGTKLDLVGFVDDGEPDLKRIAALGLQVLGPVSALSGLDVVVLLGTGSPRVRARLDDQISRLGKSAAPAVVHQSAAIGRQVQLDVGSVVCAQAVVTTNVVAGRHLHLNLGATIGHDCRIGDHVTIAPGANISGNVTIGHRVEFGTGCAVLPGVRIGHDAIIGAGAVVNRDVGPGTTVVGVPARPIHPT